MELASRLEWARQIAVEAGKVTLDFYQTSGLNVETKADGSPLTLADQAAEKLLMSRIADRFPHDSIIGEEFGESRGTNEYRWILDPIDGTKSFICGVPLYGTMVGVELAGQAVIGSIYFPPLDEGMYAARGMGAVHFRRDQSSSARVSKISDLSQAVVLTTSVEAFGQRHALESYLGLSKQAKFARTWGDVYGYLLVATGRAEIMIDPLMNVWDAAALLPIIEESGGRFTDWQGKSRIDSGDSIGSNGLLHELVVQQLRAP
jgi:histidinol-phosphatase